MDALASLLPLIHFIGLALGVGGGTVKVVLLLQSTRDQDFVPVYLKVARPITRVIILGIVMLVLSGIGWLLMGYPFTLLLGVKLALVASILALGPIIDNVVEPKFRKLALAEGGAGSAEFTRVRKQYLTLEILADLLFYAVIVIWVLR